MPSHIAARFAANAAKRRRGRPDTPGHPSRKRSTRPSAPSFSHQHPLGKKGLDFHHYCHRIWHWNLPGSPTDLEQREGRVQRYLNHAVRRNIATLPGCSRPRKPMALPGRRCSPPQKKRVEDLGMSRLGMCPHWLYTGNLDAPALIESILPLPPFSREARLTPWLIKTTALYRLAFGQAATVRLACDTRKQPRPKKIQSLMIRLAPGNFTYAPR